MTTELNRNSFVEEAGFVRVIGNALPTTSPPVAVAKYLKKLQSLTSPGFRKYVKTSLKRSPDVWLYPMVGFDLGTLASTIPDLRERPKTFILVEQAVQFLTPERLSQSIDLKQIKTQSDGLDNDAWGATTVHKGIVASHSEDSGGILIPTLVRLRQYLGTNVRISDVRFIKQKAIVPAWRIRMHEDNQNFELETEQRIHGSFRFDLGPGTASHQVIYINGSLDSDSRRLRLGELGDIENLGLLFDRVDGIFIKGSQGILSPKTIPGAVNYSREALLEMLAENGGVLVEGMHQNPGQVMHEPDPAWEVTPDLTFGFQSKSSSGSLAVRLLMEDDSSFKLSYYPGIRMTQWTHKKN